MFIQKPLHYSFNHLEPFISGSIMELHYSKHHMAYINNLNLALQKYKFTDFANENVMDLIQNMPLFPNDIQNIIRNNLGGHINHTLFWKLMSAKQTPFLSLLTEKIIENFESIEKFWENFIFLATTLFGSGWVWLAYNPLQNKLFIKQYVNQDSPLFDHAYPVLGIDIWEHAYYLDYKNNRAEYIKKWLSVVNGEQASLLFEHAMSKKKFTL